MFQNKILSRPQTEPFYKVAGTMALLIVIVGIVDALSSDMGAGAQDNSTINITTWFELFQAKPFSTFSALGVMNITTLSMGLPMYVAFNRAFRQERPMLSGLASILFFIGTAVYISSNSVFSLFALNQEYAVATEAQKTLLEAAGQVLLAQGADLTEGTFDGIFLTQIAGLLISSLMLHSSQFSKWNGWAGVAGYGLMSIFFILTAFVPRYFDLAVKISLLGGLLLSAYQIMLAYRFLQLGSSKRK